MHRDIYSPPVSSRSRRTDGRNKWANADVTHAHDWRPTAGYVASSRSFSAQQRTTRHGARLARDWAAVSVASSTLGRFRNVRGGRFDFVASSSAPREHRPSLSLSPLLLFLAPSAPPLCPLALQRAPPCSFWPSSVCKFAVVSLARWRRCRCALGGWIERLPLRRSERHKGASTTAPRIFSTLVNTKKGGSGIFRFKQGKTDVRYAPPLGEASLTAGFTESEITSGAAALKSIAC